MQNLIDKTVSIIIPAYNMDQYIERCIKSCIAQSYKNIEIIVVNDGSVDNTYQEIEKLKAEDDRILLIRKKNEGVTLAREDGIKHSSGDYIFFLDGDDFLPKNAIENLVNKAISNDADIVLGNYSFIEESGEEKLKKQKSFENLDGLEFIKYMMEENQLYLCFKLIKKSLYKEVVIPKEITLGEDAVGIVKIAKNAKKVLKVDDVVYYYFRRSDSVTKLPKKNDLVSAYKSVQTIVSFLELNFKGQFSKEIQKIQLTQIIIYLQKVNITGYYRNDISKALSSINLNSFPLKHEQKFALKLALINPRLGASLLKNLTLCKVFLVKTRNLMKKGKK